MRLEANRLRSAVVAAVVAWGATACWKHQNRETLARNGIEKIIFESAKEDFSVLVKVCGIGKPSQMSKAVKCLDPMPYIPIRYLVP